MDKELFRQRFRAAREAKGLDRQKLANLLGVSRSAVSYYESGTRIPRLETIWLAARILGTSIDDLTGV